MVARGNWHSTQEQSLTDGSARLATLLASGGMHDKARRLATLEALKAAAGEALRAAAALEYEAKNPGTRRIGTGRY